MNETVIQLSQEKHDELVTELQERKSKTRAYIAERLLAAKELGDLKENGEYHAARDDQGKNESRIQEVEEILRRASIVTKSDGDQVELASTVTIRKTGGGVTQVFTMVSAEEADMARGKISVTSPIGSALVGKRVGDQAVVITPNGESIFEIIDLS